MDGACCDGWGSGGWGLRCPTDEELHQLWRTPLRVFPFPSHVLVLATSLPMRARARSLLLPWCCLAVVLRTPQGTWTHLLLCGPHGLAHACLGAGQHASTPSLPLPPPPPPGHTSTVQILAITQEAQAQDASSSFAPLHGGGASHLPPPFVSVPLLCRWRWRCGAAWCGQGSLPPQPLVSYPVGSELLRSILLQAPPQPTPPHPTHTQTQTPKQAKWLLP